MCPLWRPANAACPDFRYIVLSRLTSNVASLETRCLIPCKDVTNQEFGLGIIRLFRSTVFRPSADVKDLKSCLSIPCAVSRNHSVANSARFRFYGTISLLSSYVISHEKVLRQGIQLGILPGSWCQRHFSKHSTC